MVHGQNGQRNGNDHLAAQKMSARVSFIIPFYNSGSTIIETLDSIWAQSFSDYDVWLVNDGSTDAHSLEVLKEIEKNARVTVLHQENAGPSVARNMAIAQSHAELFVPLDADDLIMPNALTNAVTIMDSKASIGVVYGDVQLFGNKNKVRHQDEFAIGKQLLWNQIAVTCLIKKNVFETCGNYDTYLSKRGLEDWEFWIRVHMGGFTFSKMNEVFFQYRIASESRTFSEADVHLTEIRNYVHTKHGNLYASQYEELFYAHKMTLETPDYRLGNLLLKPWRFLKSLTA